MKDLLMWVVVLVGALIILVWVLGEAQEKQAGRLYARAHVIETKSEARQDLLAGLMPYAILGLATIGGTMAVVAMTYGLVAVATVWINRPLPPRTETHILERQIVVMLQPGQSRRDVWQQMSQADDIKLIGDR